MSMMSFHGLEAKEYFLIMQWIAILIYLGILDFAEFSQKFRNCHSNAKLYFLLQCVLIYILFGKKKEWCNFYPENSRFFAYFFNIKINRKLFIYQKIYFRLLNIFLTTHHSLNHANNRELRRHSNGVW